MGAIFTIAGRDLKSTLTGPKGGAIFFFFVLLMGAFFWSFISNFAEMQRNAPMMGGEAPTLEQLLRAVFYNLHFILILIIPAVTMASFAEERRNQALRLLMAAPVSPTAIVLGKYLACVVLMTLVLLAASVFPIYTIIFGNPDIGMIATSYLGLFLLVCAQIAFGMMISALTSNQFLAFVFTMFGLFMLLILNWIAPSMTGNSVVESVLKYLASTTHIEVFFKGMLAVTDVTYFLCFIATFLFFTNVILDSARWR